MKSSPEYNQLQFALACAMKWYNMHRDNLHTKSYEEEFENTKGVIRMRISRKNRKHNGRKNKQRSTKLTHKTKDRITRTQLKTGSELRCSWRVSSSCSPSDTCYKPGDKSWMRKGSGSVYDKWNIYVVICDIDIP